MDPKRQQCFPTLEVKKMDEDNSHTFSMNYPIGICGTLMGAVGKENSPCRQNKSTEHAKTHALQTYLPFIQPQACLAKESATFVLSYFLALSCL